MEEKYLPEEEIEEEIKKGMEYTKQFYRKRTKNFKDLRLDLDTLTKLFTSDSYLKRLVRSIDKTEESNYETSFNGYMHLNGDIAFTKIEVGDEDSTSRSARVRKILMAEYPDYDNLSFSEKVLLGADFHTVEKTIKSIAFEDDFLECCPDSDDYLNLLSLHTHKPKSIAVPSERDFKNLVKAAKYNKKYGLNISPIMVVAHDSGGINTAVIRANMDNFPSEKEIKELDNSLSFSELDWLFKEQGARRALNKIQDFGFFKTALLVYYQDEKQYTNDSLKELERVV